jgi:hypothetical protein
MGLFIEEDGNDMVGLPQEIFQLGLVFRIEVADILFGSFDTDRPRPSNMERFIVLR